MNKKTHPTVDNKEVESFFKSLKLTKIQKHSMTEFLIGRATAWEEKIEKAKSPGFKITGVDKQ